VRLPFAVSLITIGLLAGCTEAGNPHETVAPSASAQEACGPAAVTIKQHLSTPEVGEVVVQGQCTSAVIRTNLADDAGETARQLCETAAEVAYTGDINAVTVLGKSGRELAIGITGMKCMVSH
jgi:hypothetical protein